MYDVVGAAFARAARGFRVFPTRDKKPLTKGDWREAATSEPLDVFAFDWAEADGYGIALDDHVVIDIDVHGSSVVEAVGAWKELCPDCPETEIVRTPSGGFHIYFQAPEEPLSQRSPVSGMIDIRVPGKGYVCGPGAGGYVLELEAEPAPMPKSLRAVCGERAAPKAENREAVCELDTPDARRAAWDYLRRLPPNQPAGEDSYRYNLAVTLLDQYGLSEAGAGELLHRWNEDVAAYPRPSSEIDKAVTNAARYARRPPGEGWQKQRNRIEALAAAVGVTLPEPPKTLAEAFTARLQQAGVKLTARTVQDIADMPEPRWFVPGWILQHGVTALYGPPKRGKTFAAVDLALAAAYNLPWLGSYPLAEGDGVSVFLCLERPSEARARIQAWCEYHEVPFDNDRFLFVDGTAILQNTEHMAALTEALKELPGGVRLLTVDTLARAMLGADEQSSRETGLAMAALDELSTTLDAPIVVIHHSGKDAAKGMRGSTAILASVAGAISAEMEDGELTLTLQESSRGKPGRTLTARADASKRPDHPVFVPAPQRTEGAPPPRTNPDLTNAIAVVNAAASEPETGGVRIVPISDFVARLAGTAEQSHLSPTRAKSLLFRTFERHPALRDIVMAGDGQATVFPASQRSTIMRKIGMTTSDVSLTDPP